MGEGLSDPALAWRAAAQGVSSMRLSVGVLVFALQESQCMAL